MREERSAAMTPVVSLDQLVVHVVLGREGARGGGGGRVNTAERCRSSDEEGPEGQT